MALVMPMRGVAMMVEGRKPSSRTRRGERGRVTSMLFSARVMPRAWQRRPGPEQRSLRVGGDGEAAEAGHRCRGLDGLEGADEDAAGLALGLAGEVQAVVHAVDEVDVGEAGRAEEDGVAGGLADEAVGGGVGEA